MKSLLNFLSKLIVGTLAVGLLLGIGLGIVIGLVVLAREFASDEFVKAAYIGFSILGGLFLLAMCYMQGEEILEPYQHKDKYAFMEDKELENLHVRIVNEIEYRNTK